MDAFESMCKRYDCFSKKDERKKSKNKRKKNKRCLLWLRHKIVYKKGFGYRCKYCNQTYSQLAKKDEIVY